MTFTMTDLLTLLGALWAVLSAVVALTPTKADDAALARFLNRLSWLKPPDVPGRLSLPGRLERPRPPQPARPRARPPAE